MVGAGVGWPFGFQPAIDATDTAGNLVIGVGEESGDLEGGERADVVVEAVGTSADNVGGEFRDMSAVETGLLVDGDSAVVGHVNGAPARDENSREYATPG